LKASLSGDHQNNFTLLHFQARQPRKDFCQLLGFILVIFTDSYTPLHYLFIYLFVYFTFNHDFFILFHAVFTGLQCMLWPLFSLKGPYCNIAVILMCTCSA